LVAAAQGDLSPETLAPQYDALLASANVAPAIPGQVVHMVDHELRPYRSRVHLILFCTLLAEAFADLLNIFLPSLPVIVLNTLIGAALAIALLIALIRQHQTDLKPAVRALTWVSAVYVGLGYVASYVIMMVIAPAHKLDGTEWGYLKALSELKPLETPGLMVVLLVSTIIAGLLGVFGLFFLREHWRERTPPA
jgi:hypothetical protein